MFGGFLLKKMMERQLKHVPAAEQEKMIKLVSEHPELFTKIAQEVQDKMKGGKDQMAAMMEVMKSHEAELKKLL